MTRLVAGLLLLLAVGACSREVRLEPESLSQADQASLGAASVLLPTPARASVSPASDPAGGAGGPTAADPEPAAGEPASAEPVATFSTVLYSEHDAEVGARMDGVVRSIAVELGDPIRAGQVLAVLADEEEAAAVESARAVLDLARLEHTRAQQLREQNLTSQAELDQAAYRIRAAQAAVREAEVRLSYTRIRAPFPGVLSRRFIRVGQSVEKGEPLFRVTALSPLRAQIRVPELQARTLARGQTLSFRSPGGEEVRGSVTRIAPAVDPASGTIEVLVSIPSPGGLRPGSSVTVALGAQP